MFAPLLNHAVLGPATATIAGAIFGSFIGALATRWPLQQSVLTGRSRCDSCGATLQPWHLVPIFSHVALRGRCASCQHPIGSQSLAIEAMAALIGALALIVHPGWAGVGLAAFGWLLLPLAVLDLKHYWLPHPVLAALALGGVASMAAGLPPDWSSRLIGAGAGFGLLWVVAFGYRRLRGHEGLGGGDPLMLGAIGLWLGWQLLPLVLMIASGLGLAAALIIQRRGTAIDSTTRFPLGTLLALAAWPVALFGLQP